MTPGVRGHFQRASLEIDALWDSLEGLQADSGNMRRSWRVWSYLETRSFARRVSRSALAALVSDLSPDVIRAQDAVLREAAPDTLALQILGPYEAILEPLSAVWEEERYLLSNENPAELVDDLLAQLFEQDLPEALGRLATLTSIPEDQFQHDDHIEIQDDLLLRLSYRLVCAEIQQLLDDRSRRALIDGYVEWCQRRRVDLPSLDAQLQQAIRHPVVADTVEWLEQDMFASWPTDRQLSRSGLDQPRRAAVLARARASADRIAGTDAVFSGDLLPWRTPNDGTGEWI